MTDHATRNWPLFWCETCRAHQAVTDTDPEMPHDLCCAVCGLIIASYSDPGRYVAPQAAPRDPTTTAEHLTRISARYTALRETQSKADMNTLNRETRAAIRHNAERELARQDVPWLLAHVDYLAAQCRALSEERETRNAKYEDIERELENLERTLEAAGIEDVCYHEDGDVSYLTLDNRVEMLATERNKAEHERDQLAAQLNDEKAEHEREKSEHFYTLQAIETATDEAAQLQSRVAALSEENARLREVLDNVAEASDSLIKMREFAQSIAARSASPLSGEPAP